MTNRKWVELHFIKRVYQIWFHDRESVMFLTEYLIMSTNFWQDVSVAAFPSAIQPYLVPQQTECEWTSISVPKWYLISWVRGWVHLLCWTSSSQLIPWLTASKYTYCSKFYCQRVISFHYQQNVSSKTLLGSMTHLILLGQQLVSNTLNLLTHLSQTFMPLSLACEWHWAPSHPSLNMFISVNHVHSYIQRVSGLTTSQQDQSLDINLTGSE